MQTIKNAIIAVFAALAFLALCSASDNNYQWSNQSEPQEKTRPHG